MGLGSPDQYHHPRQGAGHWAPHWGWAQPNMSFLWEVITRSKGIVGSDFIFSYPPYISKWPGLGSTAIPQAGKCCMLRNCRKSFGWEETGQKVPPGGLYYQVLLSQQLHVAKSLRSSSSEMDPKSSLRTQDRQRDLHRAALSELSWGYSEANV